MKNKFCYLFTTAFLFIFLSTADAQEYRPKKPDLITSRLPPLIPYHEGELWGYADSTGSIKIKPKYKDAEPFKNQVAKVYESGWRLIDSKGNELTKRGYAGIYPLNDGSLFMVHGSDNEYGIINNKGEEIVPVVYKFLIPEYISKSGQMVFKVQLETELSQAEQMSRSRSSRDNRLHGLYDEQGKRLLPVEYSEIDNLRNGYFRACKADGCIIISSTGEILPMPTGYKASWYNDGMLTVSKDIQQYGYADKTGKLVIPARFQLAGNFSEGLASAMENNKWGLIDKTGKWVIKPVYDQLDEFKGGLAVARKGNLYGLIDKKGKELTEFIYKRIHYNQGSDYFSLNTDKGGVTAYYKSKTGELVHTGEYYLSDGFVEGLAKVATGRNNVGYINENNQLAIPLDFKEAHSFKNGLALARKDTGYGVINKEGKTVVPFTFHEMRMINPDLYQIALQSGFRGAKLYGLMNSKGEEVLPVIYTKIDHFESDLTTIYHYQGIGVINNKGQVVVPVVKFPAGYRLCGEWTEGIVKICYDEQNKSGYIDRYGKTYFSTK